MGKNPRVLSAGKTKKEVIQNLWITILSGNTWQGEFINRKKNGDHFIERALIAPVFDNNKKITHFIAIKEDVTDKKRLEHDLVASEKKYRLLAEKLTDVVWVLNLNKQEFTYISSSVYGLRGYTAEEAMKQNLEESLTPESAARIVELTTERLNAFVNNENSKATYLDEVQQPCKNGTIIWVEVSTNFRYNEQREVEVVGVSRNIESRKRLEAEILNQNLLLAELNATKDKFFSIIAHDLRSPFSSLLGFSDQLVQNHKKYDDAKRERMLQIVNQSARNTFSLLDNLLTWARSQSGKIVPKKERIDLKISINKVIGLLNENAQNKQISIVNSIPDEVFIATDKNMLETVIRNLISNAIKFTPQKGEVTVSVAKQPSAYEISVSDTGTGMEKEVLETLFKIGSTKSLNGTDGERGTGLGLILCKEFVEKNGGTITVESVVEIGSTFKFSIPE
ncbi:MAG TPA: hypothetical protein DCQ31_15030 [Bacteroidales bacterium]|nr:hypothetical protein [Bacteroidales bacterium]